MKFFGSTVLAAVAASGISGVDGMSIRGNTKSANKLMKLARKLEDGAGQGNNGNGYYYANGYNNGGNNGYGGYYGGEMNEESLYFVRSYSITLLGCIQGATVVNYENGEQQSSSVYFRLCPTDTCSTYNEMGCDSGYGDYVVGINDFLEAYFEGQDEEGNNNQYQGGYQYGNQNQGGNYNQNQGGGYYNNNQNSMVAYNQYGQEFDAKEYLECREYDMEEGQEQQQQQADNAYAYYNGNYNNNQGQNNQYNVNYYQGTQFYIGPGCSADGKDIALKMYMDQMCSYPASNVNFGDIAFGWNSLPFSDGGMVSMKCAPCYGRSNDGGDWEIQQMCTENYAQSMYRCEESMESYSYYGVSTGGCDYIDTLKSTIYTTSSTNITEWVDTATNVTDWVQETTKFMDRLNETETVAFIIAMVAIPVAAIALLLCCICRCCKSTAKDEKAVALVNDDAEEELDDVMKTRSGVLG